MRMEERRAGATRGMWVLLKHEAYGLRVDQHQRRGKTRTHARAIRQTRENARRAWGAARGVGERELANSA